MVRKQWKRATLVLALALVVPVLAQAPEPVDLQAIQLIKDEGFNNSKVNEIAFYLTDVHGPRLTNSPNIRAAAEWAVAKMKEWGLTNPRLEPWEGEFGRGWRNERFSAHVITPQPFPLIGYPVAWTPGTEGPVTAEAVLAPIEREEDLAKFRGKLRGKIVLTSALRRVDPKFEAPARRLTDEELAQRAQQPVPTSPAEDAELRRQEFVRRRELAQRVAKFFEEEGVVAILEPSPWDAGVVRVGGAGGADTRRPATAPKLPRVMLAIEHYGRLYRLLKANLPVTIELNIQNRFYDGELGSFNVLADLPGTDKADELVMLGAHFDSWHAGTGATDNAAGSVVMMEAMRILKATGLKLRRTVRLALWTGEEQGLLGSREYVRKHFADPQTMQLKPGHAKFSVYFNIDNGTGKIRGIYLQGNEAVAPIFAQWMEPFRNLGMTTLSIRGTGGTDHLAFDAVGLPGFQFIQDPMDYSTLTHHSNMDTFERLQEADLKQMAVIVAAFVYHAANRNELLPRKPLPKPGQRGQGPPPIL
ncbi:MAG: M20/M25/M40 family metallo-hydrolase [Firmicutes bacterium]|nr:M20/M25/M40 family metallo-hydrolase [Bacillota bacterium]